MLTANVGVYTCDADVYNSISWQCTPVLTSVLMRNGSLVYTVTVARMCEWTMTIRGRGLAKGQCSSFPVPVSATAVSNRFLQNKKQTEKQLQ